MNVFLIISALLILLAFGAAAQGFENLKKRYAPGQMRVDRIDRADRGWAEVNAGVTPTDEVLTAPFSGLDCVCYEIVVEEKHEYAEGAEWAVSSRFQNGVPFYLEDESGSILVDPYGADLQMAARYEERVPAGVVPPDPLRSFGETLPETDPEQAEALDLNLFTCQTNRDTRFLEYHISPDDLVWVFGEVMHREDGRNAYYDDRDTLLLHRSAPSSSFLIHDRPADVDLTTLYPITSWFVGGTALFLVGLLALAAGV